MRKIFVSEGVSHCQVVLVKQNEDVWMMHTSPAGISGGRSFGAPRPTPNPFSQISSELDISAITKVIVIPSFTQPWLWNEADFLQRTRLKKEATEIEILDASLFYKEVASRHERHHVGYDIDNDRLWLVAGDRLTTAHRFNHVFAEICSSERAPIVYSLKSETDILLVETNELDLRSEPGLFSSCSIS